MEGLDALTVRSVFKSYALKLFTAFRRLSPLTHTRAMVNLFSGMTGFTFPNTVRDAGPLPPLSTGGMQSEFQTPDGMINETSALLSNVDAYSYGPNSERPSTQTSYVNHPHRIQKVIPKMFLPAAQAVAGEGDIALEHALADGDLTFTLRMPKVCLFFVITVLWTCVRVCVCLCVLPC